MILSLLACYALAPQKALVFDAPGLKRELESHHVKGFGFAVSVGGKSVSVEGDRRFSLQSVMKLVVAMAILDRVDKGSMTLTDKVLITLNDRSIGVQPIADRIGPNGYRAPLSELIQSAVQKSDSCAADVLADHLGGIPAVQAFLRTKGLDGIRIDRNERHLQAETVGLTWGPSLGDPAVFKTALAHLSKALRDAATAAYRRDIRDTATPLGMARLLSRFAEGKLLSSASTEWLWGVMQGTTTFPTRLKAGVPAGWSFGHKTGSSRTWRGLTVASNDVGLAKSPEGDWVVMAAYLGNSVLDDVARDRVLAGASAAVFRHLR